MLLTNSTRGTAAKPGQGREYSVMQESTNVSAYRMTFLYRGGLLQIVVLKK